VDFFAANSDFFGCWDIVPVRNNYRLTDRSYLAPVLRRIIFVSEAPHGEAFDFEGVDLRIAFDRQKAARIRCAAAKAAC